MQKPLLAACCLLVAAFCGCAGPGEGPRAGAPPWVGKYAATEARGRFFAALGAAGPQPAATVAEEAGPEQIQELLKREADRAAREELSGLISEHAQKLAAGFLQKQDDYPGPDEPLGGEFVEVLTKEVTAALMRQTLPQETWQDERGRLYVLYRVPVVVVHRALLARMRYTVRHVNPFGKTADSAVERMRGYLDEQLEERLVAAREEEGAAEAESGLPTPGWLARGRHPDYPPAEFFSAVGLADTLEGADLAARRELALAIDARLQREVEVLRRERPDSALLRDVEAMSPERLRYEADDLVAIRLAEQWHDALTDTHYVLSVLDRSTAELLYRRRLNEAAEKCRSVGEAARNHRKAENYVSALRQHLAAIARAADAVEARLNGLTVAPEEKAAEFAALPDGPLLTSARQRLEQFLQTVHVKKAGGDEQWMPPGVAPALPLRVLVTAEQWNTPVADAPLVLLHAASGRVLGRAVTGPDGTAEWHLERPPASTGHGVLVARLDLQALSAEAPPEGLEASAAEFSYFVRSRQNSSLAVHVLEGDADGEPEVAPLDGRLESALTKAGFQVVDAHTMRRKARLSGLDPASSPTEVTEAFAPLGEHLASGRFLLVVSGHVSPRLKETVKTDEGTLYIVYCPFELVVLDAAMPPGKCQVMSVEGVGKGWFLEDPGEATRRARLDAATVAAKRLTQKLGRKLSSAG